MFCILLHPLQVLLVTFETPGVVFDLGHHIALFQAKIKNICLLLLLLLLLNVITIITAKERKHRVVSFELHRDTKKASAASDLTS